MLSKLIANDAPQSPQIRSDAALPIREDSSPQDSPMDAPMDTDGPVEPPAGSRTLYVHNLYEHARKEGASAVTTSRPARRL